MRSHSGLAAALVAVLVAVALVAAPGRAHAETGTEGTVARTARELWETIQQLTDQVHPGQEPRQAPSTGRRARGSRPAPEPIATGGRTLDLSDLSRADGIDSTLRDVARLSGSALQLTIPDGQARLGDYSIGSDQTLGGHLLVLRGDADVYGALRGNLVTYEGDVIVHPGGSVSGDVLAIHGKVRDEGGEIGGEARTLEIAPAAAAAKAPMSAATRVLYRLLGVLGVGLAMLVLGFAVVVFGRSNLEIVADTVTHSFGRAFVTGLIGQILLLPTFGMLVVGLVLSVAGILLLPFAVAVYALLVIGGVVGGTLAVAHAMGETYTRRRLAAGKIGSPSSHRFMAAGLALPLVLWLAWSLMGWVPVAGDLVRGAAVLVTWIMATVGLGAALLSRGGVTGSFAGRIIPPESLTDEYLWATPQFGVPAVRRPGTRGPGSGR